MVARSTCNIWGGPVVSLHIVLAITGGVLTHQRAASDADSTDFDDRFAAARARLLAICTGLVGADAAQDIVQDTYLRARSRQQQLRDPAAFDAWLVRIAINLAHNHQRRARGLLTTRPYAIVWTVDGCPYTLWVGEGLNLDDARRYAAESYPS
jgi:DNA-directed RNA polymerase specialized sigma24 family protein